MSTTNQEEDRMSTRTPAVQALTYDETRIRLGVGRSTLYRMVAERSIPSFKLGRSRRFLAEDVDAYLRQARDEQNAQTAR